jgi:hypothetical protein
MNFYNTMSKIKKNAVRWLRSFCFCCRNTRGIEKYANFSPTPLFELNAKSSEMPLEWNQIMYNTKCIHYARCYIIRTQI